MRMNQFAGTFDMSGNLDQRNWLHPVRSREAHCRRQRGTGHTVRWRLCKAASAGSLKPPQTRRLRSAAWPSRPPSIAACDPETTSVPTNGSS